jgi:hypothetical protein
MASSSRANVKEAFELENKIWMLRNMQGKFDITRNPNTKMMINKLKKEVA